jgi:diguanylate cyclase (GGDEF)-like protein
LLRLAAAEMRAKLRRMDVAGRVGGDEFVLVLPEADAVTARVVLERVVKAVSAVLESKDLFATFSAGAVVCSGIPGSIDEMLRQADSAMYRAKQDGPGNIELERFDPTAAADSPEPVMAGRHA